MEGGLMHFLVDGLQGLGVEKSTEKDKIKKLLNNYQEHVHNKFNNYAYCFFFCELMNIFVSISQIFVTDIFLNYQFMDYGYAVFNYYRLDEEERNLGEVVNPMCHVFPKVATCNYMRYGRGGGLDSRLALCILGLNIINDKVFLILWYWHGVLIVAGIVRVITRSLQLMSSSVRHYLMEMTMNHYLNNNKHTKHIQHYVTNCSIGDWFILYQMNKNMNKRIFAEFLALLSMKVNPDPYLSADPLIDIFKKEDEDVEINGEHQYGRDRAPSVFDEEQLETMKNQLKRKLAQKSRLNMFTRRRHLKDKKRMQKENKSDIDTTA